MSFHTNHDIKKICTPVNATVLYRLLRATNYDQVEMRYLYDGFRQGFDFYYEGPKNRIDTLNNLPFRIGNKYDLWEKVMKEVKLGRYAGPYTKIPYCRYIQSPVGLVPKAGNQTRLIFHLSYDFKQFKSFNHYIPQERCTVKYNDLDRAILNCLKWYGYTNHGSKIVYLSKGDIHSTFRIVPGQPNN